VKKIFLLGLVIGCLNAQSYFGKVVKVTDGDTINVQTQNELLKVRILLIDTPEKYGGSKMEKDSRDTKTSQKEMRELGTLSSSYAKNFFPVGSDVEVLAHKKDRYGRTLGVVVKNGVNYSYQIVKDGYSCIYKKEGYPMQLENLLDRAKQNRLGLWGKNFRVMEALCY